MSLDQHRLSIGLLTVMACALFVLLALATVRNARHDKALIQQNALSQGYWIARSLEIGHRMMTDDHVNALRQLLVEVEQTSDVRYLIVLDQHRQVIVASDATQEGTQWPDVLDAPSQTGRIIGSQADTMDLAFPAFFATAFQHMPEHHPSTHGNLDQAKWVVLRLDISEELAHYRSSVIQSVGVSLGVVILGLGAFWVFGMIQRYRLANASIEQLEQVKYHLTRFVPGTVQKLIEENPMQPSLDKIEREATVLFLDIDHYTTIAAEIPPEELNRLVETYFSSFLDIILSHGGEINETAGDGIMAIFTGKAANIHAWNAVKAAMAIREKAKILNRLRISPAPKIVVNIGINTGQVLIGATMIQGEVGERLTYTASGMVTNLAARLCDLGSQGEIHITDTTAKWVSNQCSLRGPREVNLKNIQGTTLAYQVQ